MDEFEAARKVTRELASVATAKNKRQFVFEELEHINRILKSGTTIESYVDTLNDSGLSYSIPLFKKYLHEARAAAGATAARPSSSQIVETPKDKGPVEVAGHTKGSSESGKTTTNLSDVEEKIGYRIPDSSGTLLRFRAKR